MLMVAMLVLVGCTSQQMAAEKIQPSAPVTVSGGNAVTIANFAFSPATLTIQKGETVTWTNQDSAPHTITSDSGSELASGTLNKGSSYAHTFNEAGTYSYHCSIHPMMKGTIVVE